MTEETEHTRRPPAAPASPGAPAAPTSRDRGVEQRERNARFAPVLPQVVSWPRVGVFVVLAMGLAWAACSPMWVSGQGLAYPLSQVLMALMMFSPTVAALAVVFLGGRPKSVPRLLGLGPIRPVGRTLGMTALSLGLFCVLPFLGALLGGAFGLVQLDLAGLSGAAAQIEMLGVPGMEGMTPETYVLINVLAVPVNALVSSLAAFGEELGWRGWLLPNLLPLGRWPALLLSSVIWALWHAPIILLGYNFGYTDARGLALMTGFCLGLGVFFGWLRLRTASVWPAVVGHGAVNAATAATLLLLHADQLTDTGQIGIGTFLGLPGWALMAVLIVVLVVSGQFRKQAEPGVPLGR